MELQVFKSEKHELAPLVPFLSVSLFGTAINENNRLAVFQVTLSLGAKLAGAK